MNRKNLIERIIRSIIKSTELFARIILIFREIIAKESQDRHNFLIIPRRRWREEGRIKSTIYRVFKRFKSVSRFEAHAFTRDACVPGNIRGITRYTHAHTFVQIGVSRVAHCIYYCYYYYFVSFPFVLPPPDPSSFFSSFATAAKRRERERQRKSERARRPPSDAGTPFVVWQRACENTTGIFHFSRRSRAPTTASRCHVTRHSFRNTYIYTAATSRLPGVALINVEAFIKAARCEYPPSPLPLPLLLPSLFSLLSSEPSLFLASFRFSIFTRETDDSLSFQGKYDSDRF